MAHIVIRKVRGFNYYAIRDSKGRQLAWLGRDPSPEKVRAAMERHKVKPPGAGRRQPAILDDTRGGSRE